jgi:2-oxoglutarate ferredoxin oxidoreductase subunit alpha
LDNADKIIMIEEDQIDNAEIVVVSYGITSRVAIRAVQLARKAGMKIGTLRLKTVWPFPEKRIKQLARKIKAFVVPEINYGQVVLEVERCAAGKAATYHVPHMGGWVHDPDDILKVIKEATK